MRSALGREFYLEILMELPKIGTEKNPRYAAQNWASLGGISD